MGDEYVTSIEHYDKFHVNLLFDRFFIDRCAHIWVMTKPRRDRTTNFEYNSCPLNRRTIITYQ